MIGGIQMVSAKERRKRAARHVLFIENQIEQLAASSDPASRTEQEFQWWRQGLLERHASADAAELRQRLADIKAVTRREIWADRHKMVKARAKDDAEWRALCEAAIIEYLLGLYPEVKRNAV